MKKTGYHHGHLEEALLDVGLREAKVNGPRNLGVTQLAKKVNVSAMAIYRHFPNGESLRASISQQAREELARQMLKAIEKETDLKRRFQAIGRTYIEFALKEPGLYSVAFLACYEDPKREDNPSIWNILQEGILEICNAGLITSEEIPNVAALAWATVHGYAELAGMSDPYRPKPTKKNIDDLLDRAWMGIISKG